MDLGGNGRLGYVGRDRCGNHSDRSPFRQDRPERRRQLRCRSQLEFDLKLRFVEVVTNPRDLRRFLQAVIQGFHPHQGAATKDRHADLGDEREIDHLEVPTLFRVSDQYALVGLHSPFPLEILDESGREAER